MAKLKTKKTAIKRVKITKSGKVLKKAVSAGHLKRKWSTSKKHRKSGLSEQTNKGHLKMFQKILPKIKIKDIK